MTTTNSIKCSSCGHENPSASQFCNNCGKTLETAALQPVVWPTPSPVQPAVAEEAHDKSHHSQMFYFWVFFVLAVITIVEVFLTNIDNTTFRITSLFVLSAAKFALVAMFFMHLSGDKRMFQILFLGPLFIGSAILVSLVGLFQNF
jgi:cytochrome c oxidase subunit 4/cytochrome o ubiquinol oxidase operon protein cyoD